MVKIKCRALVSLAMIIILASISVPQIQAAKVFGDIYGPDLDLLKKAVIEVDSVPRQTIVAADGFYSFELAPGNYTIEAFYPIQGILLYGKEEISIPTEGNYVYDLILFEIEDLESIEFDESELELIEELLKEKKPVWAIVFSVIAILIILGIVVVYLLYKYKKIKKKSKKVKKLRLKKEKKEKLVGDELFNKVVAFIKKEKRVTQKEIRKKFNVSEAKISLLITDLEERSLVKKIKRGRGNIIIYTKKRE